MASILVTCSGLAFIPTCNYIHLGNLSNHIVWVYHLGITALLLGSYTREDSSTTPLIEAFQAAENTN